MARSKHGMPGIYNAAPLSLADGEGSALALNSQGELVVNLEASSLNIGQVEGTVASGVADTGNPVKVGGKYNSSAPTFANGQRGDLQLTNAGNLKVTMYTDGTTSSTANQDISSDSVNASAFKLAVANFNYGLNGASWDRIRLPNVFKSLNAVLITSETTIWTPAASKKFRLMGFVLTQGVVTGAITLKDNTGGSTILIIPPNTTGVFMLSPKMGNGILSAAANNVLTATGVATETLTGFVFGTEE